MTPEVIEHVLNEHDIQIKELKKNMHGINNSLSIMSSGFEDFSKQLNDTLKSMSAACSDFTQRIIALEIRSKLEKELEPLRNDLKSREEFKKMAGRYWYIIAIIILLTLVGTGHIFGLNVNILENFILHLI